MRRMAKLFGAGALLIGSALAVSTPSFSQPTSGSISPAATTGQPGVECDEEGAVLPGNAGELHGSSGGLPGSPFVQTSDSVSGTHYAGEQPGINDKNTAAVSQYDIGCFPGPDRPESE